MTPDKQTLNFHRRKAVLLSQQVLSSPINDQVFKKECPLLRPLDICSKTKKCPSTVSMNPPESVHDAAIHTIRYYRNNYNRYNKELYYYFNVKFLNPRIISRLHAWAFIVYLNVFDIQNILPSVGCCRWNLINFKYKLTGNVVSDLRKGTKENQSENI